MAVLAAVLPAAPYPARTPAAAGTRERDRRDRPGPGQPLCRSPTSPRPGRRSCSCCRTRWPGAVAGHPGRGARAGGRAGRSVTRRQRVGRERGRCCGGRSVGRMILGQGPARGAPRRRRHGLRRGAQPPGRADRGVRGGAAAAGGRRAVRHAVCVRPRAATGVAAPRGAAAAPAGQAADHAAAPRSSREQQQRRAERAESDATRDVLAGLANRRAWDRVLAAEEVRCQRYGRPAQRY